MHIMTRWVCVCVCACMIGKFSPTLSSRYYFSHSCCFCFRAIRGKGCIEKTHTIRHTKNIFEHTPKFCLSHAHGQVCILIGSLRDQTRLTQTHRHAHTFSLRRNAKRRKDKMMEQKTGGEGRRKRLEKAETFQSVIDKP